MTDSKKRKSIQALIKELSDTIELAQIAASELKSSGLPSDEYLGRLIEAGEVFKRIDYEALEYAADRRSELIVKLSPETMLLLNMIKECGSHIDTLAHFAWNLRPIERYRVRLALAQLETLQLFLQADLPIKIVRRKTATEPNQGMLEAVTELIERLESDLVKQNSAPKPERPLDPFEPAFFKRIANRSWHPSEN